MASLSDIPVGGFLSGLAGGIRQNRAEALQSQQLEQNTALRERQLDLSELSIEQQARLAAAAGGRQQQGLDQSKEISDKTLAQQGSLATAAGAREAARIAQSERRLKQEEAKAQQVIEKQQRVKDNLGILTQTTATQDVSSKFESALRAWNLFQRSRDPRPFVLAKQELVNSVADFNEKTPGGLSIHDDGNLPILQIASSESGMPQAIGPQDVGGFTAVATTRQNDAMVQLVADGHPVGLSLMKERLGMVQQQPELTKVQDGNNVAFVDSTGQVVNSFKIDPDMAKEVEEKDIQLLEVPVTTTDEFGNSKTVLVKKPFVQRIVNGRVTMVSVEEMTQEEVDQIEAEAERSPSEKAAEKDAAKKRFLKKDTKRDTEIDRALSAVRQARAAAIVSPGSTPQPRQDLQSNRRRRDLQSTTSAIIPETPLGATPRPR